MTNTLPLYCHICVTVTTSIRLQTKHSPLYRCSCGLFFPLSDSFLNKSTFQISLERRGLTGQSALGLQGRHEYIALCSQHQKQLHLCLLPHAASFNTPKTLWSLQLLQGYLSEVPKGTSVLWLCLK